MRYQLGLGSLAAAFVVIAAISPAISGTDDKDSASPEPRAKRGKLLKVDEAAKAR